MINPSASGWIDKFFIRLKNKLPAATDVYDFYKLIRDTGFIYGHVTALEHIDKKDSRGWTDEETTKAALLNVLYELYRRQTGEEDYKLFVNKTILFYQQMTPEGYNFLKRVLPVSPRGQELESILDQRIKTNNNLISRNFSHVLTNTLLFIDVLAFNYFLQHSTIPTDYLKKLEAAVVSIASLALQIKTNKTAYDDLLLRLFEASVRYTKLNNVTNSDDLDKMDFDYFQSEMERFYLLDIAAMALWSDSAIQQNEIDFLYKVAEKLQIAEEYVAESIADFDIFIRKNKSKIPHFKYSNPVKHFYGHASQNVVLLIKRNKRRLVKELFNNRELMILLTHSAHRNLNNSEKKKIKKQLLEICKTIPSLTIFLLPGGSLLLPLLIKLIPKMLPSVFNENLDHE